MRPAIADSIGRSAPSALRNRDPIANVLQEWLPASGRVLEIASGTGEHAVHFARRFPALQWQPSDRTEEALASIRAWSGDAGLTNLLEPLLLDAADPAWPVGFADALLCINMAHISPWTAMLGVLEGASRILPEQGSLILYGPWFADDVVTAPSNRDFDIDLRGRDPDWGIRRIEDLVTAAEARGITLLQRRSMPANNIVLLLRRSGAGVK